VLPASFCNDEVVREPRIVFVMSPYQNAFFFELAEAFVDALVVGGVRATVTTEAGDFEVDDDDVFVLMPPHEYTGLEGDAILDDPLVAGRTIGMSAEQPHEIFFERNVAVASRLGAVLDLSPFAVEAYRRSGVDAAHQPFGYVPAWDRAGSRSDRFGIEVLYLGNKRPRRLGALAGAADVLVATDATLIVSDHEEPNRASSPSFVAGDVKRDLLASTRLLLNLHQGPEQYFEWLRFADAAHCAVPVLSETSVHSDPFVAGVHFLSFEPGSLAAGIEAAIADEERLAAVGTAAYELVRSRPLSTLLDPLLAAADAARERPPASRLAPRTRHEPAGRDRTDPTARAAWRLPRRETARRLVRGGDHARVLAPEGTSWRAPLTLEHGDSIATCMADGLDGDGAPTLEGLWPWEPWRLRHGQHLGRVMAVDVSLLDAVNRWIVEPWVGEHPYVAVQLFAAVHGVPVRHVPRPLARLGSVIADPVARLPHHVAERCRQILESA